MSNPHWRWLTDLEFKRREEVPPELLPDALALFKTCDEAMLSGNGIAQRFERLRHPPKAKHRFMLLLDLPFPVRA